MRVIFLLIIEPSGTFPQKALSLYHKSFKLKERFFSSTGPWHSRKSRFWELENRMSKSPENLVVHEPSFHPSFLKATLLDDFLSEHEEGGLVHRPLRRKHEAQV